MTETTTLPGFDVSTSADSVSKPTGAGTPADALGVTKRMGDLEDSSNQSGGGSPTDEELMVELRRLASVLGRSPTAKQTRERGDFPVHVYRSRFGSWNGAKEAAGLDQNAQKRQVATHPEVELLEALEDLSGELGRTPTSSEMDVLGQFTAKTYQDRFGSWNEALEQAGLSVNRVRGASDGYLVESLIALADELGRTPRVEDMDLEGSHSAATYVRRFGSWNEALETAGLGVNKASPGDGYYGIGWNEETRETVRNRQDRRCKDCDTPESEYKSRTGKRLDVHHIIRADERENPAVYNAPRNLVALCRGCHLDRHSDN